MWAQINVALIPITDTTFPDTAPPGWYCWRLEVTSGGFETTGSGVHCDEIELLSATGLTTGP